MALTVSKEEKLLDQENGQRDGSRKEGMNKMEQTNRLTKATGAIHSRRRRHSSSKNADTHVRNTNYGTNTYNIPTIRPG